ncbi:MAG TPA: DUF4157 domain-containing protein, partial [Thermoanaerobaculia bacterium]|nr:DUF4157 domain-containing protein [Thermoanaerobaculia bacterium]
MRTFARNQNPLPWGPSSPLKLPAKLKVDTLGDPLEREADRIADQVEGSPGGATPGGALRPDRGGKGAENAPAIAEEALRSPGQPLDPSTRGWMESRFGHDFGRVRVHSGATASVAAQAVDALAYTVGPDVVFGRGQYSPQTHAGRHLLAHELAHVAQQAQGHGPTVQRKTYFGPISGAPGNWSDQVNAAKT